MPPTSIAGITGRLHWLMTRDETKAPNPANAACPRVMWPEKPVTQTMDAKMMM